MNDEAAGTCRSAGMLILAVIILLGGAAAREIKRDPNTGMIRVLYVGAPFSARGPYPFLLTDPLLVTTPISGNMFGLRPDTVKKAMRLYMPRTREGMVSKYDVIGLDDSTHTSFTLNALTWFRDGCREDGLGIFMGGGSEAFGGAHGFPTWEDTPVMEVMSVDPLPMFQGGVSRNQITEPGDEFARNSPWDEFDGHNTFAAYNVVAARPGSHQISTLTGSGRRDPGWTWWDVGEGRFFSSPTGFRGSIGGPDIITSASLSFLDWKHYPDFVSNMAYFTAGLTPPSDLQLLYSARRMFREIDIQRQLTSGMLEFAARFNADTKRVDQKLDASEELLRAARGYFVELELEQSLESADQVMATLEEAYELAFKARESALAWVFFTEWVVVTSTAMICGMGLWTLMVRRRLYREVPLTRIRPGTREKLRSNPKSFRDPQEPEYSGDRTIQHLRGQGGASTEGDPYLRCRGTVTREAGPHPVGVVCGFRVGLEPLESRAIKILLS